jgi:hypothetical protein
MGDFLLVVPSGWTQLDWQFITNNVPQMSMNEVMGGTVLDIEERLKSAGVLAADAALAEFKLIDDTYFLVRLG